MSDGRQREEFQKGAKRVVCCIVGWHFPPATYLTSNFPAHLDLYLLSHKPIKDIPSWVFELIPNDRIIVRSNIGYDWGAYQQFIEAVEIDSYETVVFMHDDVEILSSDVFEEVYLTLEKVVIVGVKRNPPSDYTKLLTPAILGHMDVIPARKYVVYPIVRGSFFAMRVSALQAIHQFPVFWDRFGIDIAYGNHSLNAFCCLMAMKFGGKNFGYLDDSWSARIKPSIRELKRGGGSISDYHVDATRSSLARLILPIIRGVVRRVLAARTEAAWGAGYKTLWLTNSITRWLSGRSAR